MGVPNRYRVLNGYDLTNVDGLGSYPEDQIELHDVFLAM